MDTPDYLRFMASTTSKGPTDCTVWTGSTGRRGYGLFRLPDGKTVHAHRWIYQYVNGEIPKGNRVDHRFHCDPRCVTPSHLREVTHKQNLENRKGAQANSRSGVRGVYWHKGRKKWCAKVKHNGKNIHVGVFDSLKDADDAVRAKRLELFTHSDGR